MAKTNDDEAKRARQRQRVIDAARRATETAPQQERRKKITPSPGRRNKIASFSLRPNTIRRLNEIAERRGQSGEFCSKSGIIDELVKREARKYKGIA